MLWCIVRELVSAALSVSLHSTQTVWTHHSKDTVSTPSQANCTPTNASQHVTFHNTSTLPVASHPTSTPPVASHSTPTPTPILESLPNPLKATQPTPIPHNSSYPSSSY